MPDDEKSEDAKDWLEAELEDSIDEDYELELEDAALSLEIKKYIFSPEAKHVGATDPFPNRLLYSVQNLLKKTLSPLGAVKTYTKATKGREKGPLYNASSIEVKKNLNPEVQDP